MTGVVKTIINLVLIVAVVMYSSFLCKGYKTVKSRYYNETWKI